MSPLRTRRWHWRGVWRCCGSAQGEAMRLRRAWPDTAPAPLRARSTAVLVTNKLTLDRFCEDWRIKLMCTSGPCPRSALEESSNGIGGHRPYRGHGPLVHNPCPGQWFYPSLFGSGSSGLGFALVADGFLRQFGWLRQANSGSIGAKQTAKMTKKTPPARKQARSAA